MRVFDSHVHLDRMPAGALPGGGASGSYRAMVPGIEPAQTRNAIERLAIPGARFAAAIHPWYLLADDVDDPSVDARWADLRDLAASDEVSAIGETGLDRWRFTETEERARVERWFAWHVALAREVDKPLVVHCVRAHADCLRVIARAGGPCRGVIHAFGGSAEEAAAYRRAGFMLGIGAAATRERSTRVRAVARAIPDDQLLVETDAPYMAADGRPRDTGTATDIVRVIEEVAVLRGTTPDAIAELTWQNAERLFGPPADG